MRHARNFIAMEEKVCIAQRCDVPRIKEIFAAARAFMAQQGNPQWQDGFPYDGYIQDAVSGGNLRKLVYGGEVVAVYSVFERDEEYDAAGFAWLTERAEGHEGYLAVHTLAVAPAFRGRGAARRCIDEAVKEGKRRGKVSLKMDTHACNVPMQKLLAGCGFICCGSLTRANGTFLCYEKVI